ncbi:hypothetical protein HOY82DRAFT_540875 [Tuber indicum]|nr:hypothetical protein HOY82DRAFT_540875 [Tuber indicum]
MTGKNRGLNNRGVASTMINCGINSGDWTTAPWIRSRLTAGKDLGVLRAEVRESFGKVQTAIKKGFGEGADMENTWAETEKTNTKIEKTHTEIEKLRALMSPFLWQVAVLTGGAALIIGFIIKGYLTEILFTKPEPPHKTTPHLGHEHANVNPPPAAVPGPAIAGQAASR